MAALRTGLQLAAHKFGFHIRRYPQSDPVWRATQLKRHYGVDLVVDVGANDGSYGASIRRHGYQQRILSFEPLAEPFDRLQARSQRDPKWSVMQVAVGDEEKMVAVNVAGNAAASSSVLPMLERHRKAAPSSAYVGSEDVQQSRLDELLATLGCNEDRVFLKIDVQGYERAVMGGAKQLLESGRIQGLQIELSFTPMYQGAMTWQEGFESAAGLGMTLMSLDAVLIEESGQMLQADAVFFRDGD